MFNKLFLSLTIAYLVNSARLFDINQPNNISLSGNFGPGFQSGAATCGGIPCNQIAQSQPQPEPQTYPQPQPQPCPQPEPQPQPQP
ncbi:hypothetical protein K502DRAFT_354028, partial [Neoconidiobolus thromboides FSU 785]